jgi:hypothetical protein
MSRGVASPWTAIIGTADGVWRRSVTAEETLPRVQLPLVLQRR